METVLMAFLIFYILEKKSFLSLFNLKAIFTQPLLHLYGKRKHCVKFHFLTCNERRHNDQTFKEPSDIL